MGAAAPGQSRRTAGPRPTDLAFTGGKTAKDWDFRIQYDDDCGGS